MGLQLATQLTTAAMLVIVMTLIHGGGVVGIARLLGLDGEPRRMRRKMLGVSIVLSEVALLLFALHLVEIGVFAAFYLMVGAFETLEEAIFFSTSAYSTLSQPAEGFPIEWRVVGSIEGLIGFLLIGWSTAFFVTDMNRLLRPSSPQ